MTTINTIPLIDVLGGLEGWINSCHAASLKLVKSGLLLDTARVACGFHPSVSSQHSWVVIGDPYDKKSIIVDPTVWWHIDKTKPHILVTGMANDNHHPHGYGSIWEYGRPPEPTDPIIKLAVDLSPIAQNFINMAAPNGLDRLGWHFLANAPVIGWPASEIIAAIADTEELAALVPIDILGMVTDRNPGGLYK